jgi:hypothetical protein
MEHDQVQRWCEISDRSERKRFEALSQALSDAGCPNEVVFIETPSSVSTPDQLSQFLQEELVRARQEFRQIRIGGRFQEIVLKGEICEQVPATTRLLKATDALLFTKGPASIDSAQGRFLPRNFLFDGISETISSEVRVLDFSGPILIIGANPEARAVVGALIRFGFSRFSIIDLEDQRTSPLVEDFRRNYFGVDFQIIRKDLFTQIPGVHSCAINVLKAPVESAIFESLSYFNFMKPEGIWLDLSMDPQMRELENEAVSLGFRSLKASHVVASADRLWTKAAFGVEIDLQNYISQLEQSANPTR